MTITLNDQDLQTLDVLIKKTPFEFSFPIWKLLTDKIAEEKNKLQQKLPEMEQLKVVN